MTGSDLGWGIAIVAVLYLISVFRRGYRQGRGEVSRKRVVLDSATGEAVDVGDGEFEQEVRGESHYQKALARIAGAKGISGKRVACSALLVPEPSNPYDRNAVQVIVSGALVGYLPRDEARVFSRWCARKGAANVTCNALIVGGWDNDKSEGSYGIRLDINIG